MPTAETWWTGTRDWPGLVAGQREQGLRIALSDGVRDQPYLSGAVALPPWDSRASTIGSVSPWFACAALLQGPLACAPALTMYAPHLDRAIDEAEAAYASEPQHWGTVKYSLLSFLNVLRCCGWPLPPTAQSLSLGVRWLERTLPLRRRMTEENRLEAAFAAVGSRETGLAARFVGGGALPKRLRPGQTFGREVGAFVRYLAVAVEAGAPADAIQPAWLDFLGQFPHLYTLRNSPIHWQHLLWGGYIVRSVIGQCPAETVAADLHAFILRLAASETPGSAL